MEEIKAPQSAPLPPSTAPSQPTPPLPPLPPKPKKRPLDRNAYIQYTKMRAVIRDLRPHFLEVLKTPEFRNCKAANEIRERIKLLQDMYIMMMATTSESLYIEKTSNVLDGQSLSVDNQDQRSREQHHDGKQGGKSSTKSYESNHPSSHAPEKHGANDGQTSGTYIVGGSAFGWNFIAFTGTEPVYYGVTKEEFRKKNPIVSSES
ncbi:uncharacterized protein LOC111460466 [Cucurbita moschata]|uniref:Uncharacterized protein LOC111460466 n=1 Tax=Cucurbita moschata TaxID=3662 RepID=A0A6J1H517_CUCMO|nr:uncharacterized protein LOC111460466 [Cucurbita moschata]